MSTLIGGIFGLFQTFFSSKTDEQATEVKTIHQNRDSTGSESPRNIIDSNSSSKAKREIVVNNKKRSETFFALTITSEIQGCKVFIDDFLRGQVPQTVAVTSGKHTIKIEGENLIYTNIIQVDSSTTIFVKRNQFNFK